MRKNIGVFFPINIVITRCCKGRNYAPLICGSLRSLYHKLAPLRFSSERGVMSVYGVKLVKRSRLSLNDHLSNEGWSPEDPYDICEWISITIGENGSGSNYQIQVCTPMSLKHVEKKEYLLVIDKWQGIDHLISTINKEITKILEANPLDEEYSCLAKYWFWEYANHNK